MTEAEAIRNLTSRVCGRAWNPTVEESEEELVYNYILKLESRVQAAEKKLSDLSWSETKWGQ